MEQIFSKDKLRSSVEVLITKNDSCGIDGICVSKYKEYFEINVDSIYEQIINGKYIPNAVQFVELLKKNGKRRQVFIYTNT